MGVISRGIKNAFRNGIRTTSIVFILAVSISMALVMLMALKTVQAKIDNVKSSIGNIITVSPAGVRGFEGGGELLTAQNATDIAAISHVSSVIQTVSDRLRKEGTAAQPSRGQQADTAATVNNVTNLDSPIVAGSFGNRQRASQDSTSTAATTTTFSMPIMVTGINDLSSATSLSALGASQFNLTSGAKFDGKSTENVAMIGTDLATKNNLTVGQTFQAYGQDIKVVGIFDAGSKFANATIVMPIATAQTLSGQAGQINSIIVQTDSIDTITSVQNHIKTKLGDAADVSSQQDSSQAAIKPLENIKTISFSSLIGSLVAGAIIIFLAMLMIVRERRREIGVLKAIGSSNAGIMAMFTVEALVLTLTSSVIGVIFGLIFSNPVLNVLVTNSESSTQQGAGAGARGAMMRFGGNAISGAGNAIRDLHAVVGYDILLYGLLAAVVIAIIGSAIPSFFIAKISPAEVMRAE